jgi:peptidoglycan/xylan/chitin deacetylase (PgdA/CDA1 family)
MPLLTIVMYHYVRPLQRTRYPAIRGLDLELFCQQLDYLQAHYSIVSMDAVLDSLEERVQLPAMPALLTFDDGLEDHYRYVLPQLTARGLTAAFFPPAQAVLQRRVLDVQKIQYLLAACTEVQRIVEFIDDACTEHATEPGVLTVADYHGQYFLPDRFDTAAVLYVKRMLQFGLPLAMRSRLVAALFARYVSADEVAFAEELYLSVDQLRLMVSYGMHVGSHGNEHCWLSRLERAAQADDLGRSLELLQAVGMDPARRTLCYPYGDYNADTLQIVAASGFKAAVTTCTALAQVAPSERYTLPRLDTNDLPKAAVAPMNEWTRRAARQE